MKTLHEDLEEKLFLNIELNPIQLLNIEKAKKEGEILAQYVLDLNENVKNKEINFIYNPHRTKHTKNRIVDVTEIENCLLNKKIPVYIMNPIDFSKRLRVFNSFIISPEDGKYEVKFKLNKQDKLYKFLF